MLKGSYDAVLLSLWSGTSCLCKDEIPEVAKTEVSKPKRYSLSKLRLVHTPTCLRHNVEIFAQCIQDVNAKKKDVVSVTAVVLMQPCQGDAVCFYAKAKALYLAFQQ